MSNKKNQKLSKQKNFYLILLIRLRNKIKLKENLFMNNLK